MNHSDGAHLVSSEVCAPDFECLGDDRVENDLRGDSGHGLSERWRGEMKVGVRVE